MNNPENAAIENAEKIIERFGGIRPMASKVNIPVTTVQGWKKRNVIPGTRRADIIRAAQEHNVDISDLLQGARSAIANENAKTAGTVLPRTNGLTEAPAAPASFKTHMTQETKSTQTLGVTPSSPSPSLLTLEKQLAEMEKKAVAKSTFISLILMGAALGAALYLLWPDAQVTAPSENERLAALEENINKIEAEQGTLSSMIPSDLNERIATLQQQAGAAMQEAHMVSNDVLGEDAGSMEERLAKLEDHVGRISGNPQIAALFERFNMMGADPEGETLLNRSVSEMGTLFTGLQADSTEQMNATLEAARQQSDALGTTLDGVPTQDLKAAALLLGMAQFRSTLNRDNEPFQDDMQVLLKLVGEEDPDLKASLERLAPQAERGVLTPAGLTNEFKSMTGDIVVASLKGEDVSVQERAAAHLNELLQVEKNGELITGTPTQATLAKTNILLEQGDLEGAVAVMKTLDGPAAEAAAPWISKAETTLLAEQIKAMMSDSMSMKAFGRKAMTALGSYGGGKLIRNEETGISILKKEKLPIKTLKLPRETTY